MIGVYGFDFLWSNHITLGVQDGDNDVGGSDTDIFLFIDGIEIPNAFDSVDQFTNNGSNWVEIAGLVTISIPNTMFNLLSDGNAEVNIKI